jgi:FkbM family methyltransferase
MGYLSNAIRNFVTYMCEFGLTATVQIVKNNRINDPLKKIKLRKYSHPFFYRGGTTDFPILRLIIGNELVFKNLKNPKLIIDAGANVGFVSVFYANRFPPSEVIAVEMEESNFEMLKRNTNGYKNIKPVRAALWNHNGGVSFGDSNSKDSFNLVDQSTNRYNVPSVTIKELLNDTTADLIKLDIEGAEVEVLDDMRVNNIQPKVLVVELHERFREGCTKALEKYLEGRLFQRKKIYEYEVVVFQ